MPSISAKQLLRKLRNAENVRYKTTTFFLDDDTEINPMVFFSVSPNGWCPELIFVCHEIQEHLVFDVHAKPLNEKGEGLTQQCLHYRDSIYIQNAMFLGEPCKVICHYYLLPDKTNYAIAPLFITFENYHFEMSSLYCEFDATRFLEFLG